MEKGVLNPINDYVTVLDIKKYYCDFSSAK